MSRKITSGNVERINGQPVATVIGDETKLFFKRYSALRAAGIINDADHAKQFSTLAGDKAAFRKQVAVIRKQAGVSKGEAVGGTLLIKANQQTPFFDPLTLPWLN